MIRYFYYHVMYVGMINIMMFVPYLLIRDRFNGAVAGMLVGIAISTVMALVTIACFVRFPGLGLPEICDMFLPKWLTKLLTLITALTWLLAGIIVIYSFGETARMFFYPDMHPLLNILLLSSAAAWASSRSTRTVQFVHEIVIILISPLILLFLVKAVFNENMNWDAIRYVSGYISKPPTFVSVAASTFLFSGYMNLVIFNRLHVKEMRLGYRWFVPLFGTLFLAITFFVPIGFHGTVGVQDYVYLWSMTADSMALNYGFINRVLFVFLLLFTGISLLFVMNTWHTAILFIRYIFQGYKGVEEQPVARSNVWMAIGIMALSFGYMQFIDMKKNQWISEAWIILRFAFEIGACLLLIYFVWRNKKVRSSR